MNQKSATEEKKAAANYILTFFSEAGYLTDNYCLYINELVELEAKYPSQELTDLDNISDEEKEKLKNLIRTIRYYIIKTNIMYTTITKNITKQDVNQEFKELSNKLKNTFLFDRTQLDTYVIEINKFLAETVIKELQETSTQIVSNIYND